MKKVLKTAVFCLILAGTMLIINSWFNLRDVGEAKQFYGLYHQAKDTIDVLSVGSSKVYCDINPAVIWEKNGISSYNLATSSQPVQCSYYAIVEALKTQKPKVVVLEVGRILEKDLYGDESEASWMHSGMRPSMNKWNSIQASVEPKNRIACFLNLPFTHVRYEQLDYQSFHQYDFEKYGSLLAQSFKGFMESFAYTGFSEEQMITGFTGSRPITQQKQEYLQKIIDLCKEQGIALVVVNTPYLGAKEDRDQGYHYVQEYVEKQGIPYLAFNELCEEMGIDFAYDFQDEGHLNSYGASKLSAYLSDWLMRTYQLQDHRGDAAYASWDENADYSNRLLNDYQATIENGMGNYFAKITGTDYLSVITLTGDYMKEEQGQSGLLMALGLTPEQYQRGGVFVVENGSVLFEASCDEDYHYTKDLGEDTLVLKRRTLAEDTKEQKKVEEEIVIGNDNYREMESQQINDGIQIVTYDTRIEQVVDAVAFDAANQYIIIRDNGDGNE